LLAHLNFFFGIWSDFLSQKNRKKNETHSEEMLPLPTKLERMIGARINLRLFGKYIGTGHYIANRSDTDSELSSDSEEQSF
jgi:hypothetical protein